jgi:hypothetical protein
MSLQMTSLEVNVSDLERLSCMKSRGLAVTVSSLQFAAGLESAVSIYRLRDVHLGVLQRRLGTLETSIQSSIQSRYKLDAKV